MKIKCLSLMRKEMCIIAQGDHERNKMLCSFTLDLYFFTVKLCGSGLKKKERNNIPTPPMGIFACTYCFVFSACWINS